MFIDPEIGFTKIIAAVVLGNGGGIRGLYTTQEAAAQAVKPGERWAPALMHDNQLLAACGIPTVTRLNRQPGDGAVYTVSAAITTDGVYIPAGSVFLFWSPAGASLGEQWHCATAVYEGHTIWFVAQRVDNPPTPR